MTEEQIIKVKTGLTILAIGLVAGFILGWVVFAPPM